MSLSWQAANFTDSGIRQDEQKFDGFGVDGFSQEAVPYYARWIRQDLIGVYFIISRISLYARLSLVLLALIAIPLWIIALR